MGIVGAIKTVIKNNTTYRVGLLQTKAFRILKNNTDKFLEPYNITSVHWAFLGLLNDNPENLRAIDAAVMLGVEAPFVTHMFSELKAKKWVESSPDPKDSRAKIICLTLEGKKFVEKTEAELRHAMRPLIKDVSIKELVSFLSVLEKIIKNNTY